MVYEHLIVSRVILGLFFLHLLTLEDGTDKLSRNVSKLLPLLIMSEERRSQLCISFILRIYRVFC